MAKHDPTLDALFQALSDPTRRAILSRLMRGSATVSELAAPFDMALPSFMGHIARLEAGGLVRTEKQGRSRICRAEPAALAPASDWLAEQRALWEARLDRLEAYLDTLQQEDPRE
jgi:DNA-binding transcriptional ArsR family regulator